MSRIFGPPRAASQPGFERRYNQLSSRIGFTLKSAVELPEIEWRDALNLQFSAHEKLWLKNHPSFSEVWLHDRISDTLAGIPPEAFQYRLGNRSALEWVIDQYQVSTDKRSGITSDPNRDDDPEYIVRLVGQVIRVSMETVEIVNSLPNYSADQP